MTIPEEQGYDLRGVFSGKDYRKARDAREAAADREFREEWYRHNADPEVARRNAEWAKELREDSSVHNRQGARYLLIATAILAAAGGIDVGIAHLAHLNQALLGEPFKHWYDFATHGIVGTTALVGCFIPFNRGMDHLEASQDNSRAINSLTRPPF